MASIVSRQVVALWPLLSTGRQQRYGSYRLSAGNSAIAPIVYRKAAALSPLSSVGRQ